MSAVTVVLADDDEVPSCVNESAVEPPLEVQALFFTSEEVLFLNLKIRNRIC